MSKLLVLYRAGPVSGLREFHPQVPQYVHDPSRRGIPVIYATDDVGYAAGFSFDWSDADGYQFGRVNDGSWVLEVPRQFKSKVKQPCSMYRVEGEFDKILEVSTPEYLSYRSLKVIEEKKFRSAEQCMEEYGTKIQYIRTKSADHDSHIQQVYASIQRVFLVRFGWDIYHLKVKVLNRCVDGSGRILMHEDPRACAGSWTRLGVIYIGDDAHLESVQSYHLVGTYNQQRMDLGKFKRWILAHESAHEVYTRILSTAERSNYKELIDRLGFKTRYLEVIGTRHPKYTEEQFCEYIASQVVYG